MLSLPLGERHWGTQHRNRRATFHYVTTLYLWNIESYKCIIQKTVTTLKKKKSKFSIPKKHNLMAYPGFKKLLHFFLYQ